MKRAPLRVRDDDEDRADDHRRDPEWIRQQIMSLANHMIAVRGVTLHDIRSALHAIHSGRPWRGVVR